MCHRRYDERAFSLVAVGSLLLVGWLVCCVFILHSDDRMVFRLFIRLLRFILAQANNAMGLCIVRMLSTIQCFTTLTLTHAHSYAPTYACTITHMTTQMAKCQCLCLCDR